MDRDHILAYPSRTFYFLSCELCNRQPITSTHLQRRKNKICFRMWTTHTHLYPQISNVNNIQFVSLSSPPHHHWRSKGKKNCLKHGTRPLVCHVLADNIFFYNCLRRENWILRCVLLWYCLNGITGNHRYIHIYRP